MEGSFLSEENQFTAAKIYYTLFLKWEHTLDAEQVCDNLKVEIGQGLLHLAQNYKSELQIGVRKLRTKTHNLPIINISGNADLDNLEFKVYSEKSEMSYKFKDEIDDEKKVDKIIDIIKRVFEYSKIKNLQTAGELKHNSEVRGCNIVKL